MPRPLKDNLPGHDTDTAAERGWQELQNGELLDRAEADGYELFITADRQIPHQQNFTHRSIGMLILTTNSWPTLRQRLHEINLAVDSTGQAQISELDIR